MSKPIAAREGRWSRYPETILEFDLDPKISVDLRLPLDPPQRDALRAIGLDGKFGVLTAFNPRGEIITAQENERRQSRLESELENRGERFLRVDACSPDASHCERSVALVTTRENVIAIAKHYDQIAIFWFDGDHFWIVGVLSDAAPMKLPK